MAQDPGDWIVPTDQTANDPGDWVVPHEVSATHPQGQAATEQLMHDLTSQPRTSRTQGEDIQQGIAKNLVSGTAGILGMPADLFNLLKDEHKAALAYGAEKLGLISPETSKAIRSSEIGTLTPGSDWITKHVESLARAAGKDTSPAQTVPGQYAGTIAGFVPAAAAIPFGGEAPTAMKVLGSIARYGIVPAVTSESAGQLFKGTAAEPYARVAGAIAPEAAFQGISAAGRAMSPLKGALSGVTDAQAAEAQRLLDESRTAGTPLTVPEAVQQATSNGTRLADTQRVVEQSPNGAAIMRPFMAERPAQTEALGRRALDEIAGAGEPYEVAPRVQAAAQRVLNESPQAARLDREVGALGPPTTAEEAGNVIRPELQTIYERRAGMRSAFADADYGAARAADYTTNGEAANSVRIGPVIDHIDDLLTTAKGATAAALRRARATLFSGNQPDMSVTGLDNARRAIADQVSAASRAGNTNIARVLGPDGVLGRLDGALEEVPAYGQARRNFARASEPLAPFADDTAPGRILDRDQFNRNYTMPTERVAPTIERGGPSAADQFLAAAENSPRAREAFGQYYSRQLLGRATNDRGVINPDVLTATLRDNQDMLQRFPEIAANLNRVGAARTALQRLEQTPTGALAASTGKTGKEQFSAQRNLLFDPSASLAGGERTIGNTVRAIAERDPGAANQFVRQHLEQAFNEATQNNIPGANQWGGPKFAAAVMGNPQQARNLEAAMRALPDGDLKWNAFRKSLDLMEAMGKRQFVGSQTEFNAMTRKLLEMGGPGTEALIAGISPGQWPSMATRLFRRYTFDRNTGELARLFTEGNVSDLRAVARSGAKSPQGEAALLGMLARQGANGVTQDARRSSQP